MNQKTYLIILKGGVCLAFITFFFVFKDLLFPYITSKQISFNILIEILTIFWVAFIVKYPSWRPKKSWITFGLIAFMAAVLLTCFTGVNFNMSFWGNVERMLGWFHIMHFFLYYLIIITVMRTRRDWLALLHVSLITACLISLYTFSINYSTIGNTAYVAGYLIFNIYFAIFLFFIIKNWLAKSLYILSLILMLVAFWQMSNSGSLVGLGVSAILGLLLYGILQKNRRIKISTLSVAIIAILAISLVFLNKNSGFVQNNPILWRLTILVSSNKATFQVRLLSWRAAFEDFHNHPLVGTGYGNYAITFDKYFDPYFYTLTDSASYFDHAHNNVIDLLSTTGILGLASYLSIFVAAAYYLISGYRKGKLNLTTFILITSLLTAYFIQNLAIFDSFVTYISLMMTLGLLYWLSQEELPVVKDAPMNNSEAYALAGAGIVMLFLVYHYNIAFLKMLDGTIAGQKVYAQTNDIYAVMQTYKDALSYDTPIDRDSRTTYIRLVNSAQGNLTSMKDKEKGQEAIDYAIHLAELNLAQNPKDSLELMEYSQVLAVDASFNADNPEKSSNYLKQAEDAISKSIESSPRRIPPYFSKAQIYLNEGRKDDAISTIKYAISLNTKYADGHCQLAKLDFYYQQEKDGYSEMDQCLDNGGQSQLYPTSFMKQLINHYGTAQDWPRTVKLYQRYIQLEPNDVSGFINLAKLYAKVGNIEQAIATAQQAEQMDPSLKAGAEEFIKNLQK